MFFSPVNIYCVGILRGDGVLAAAVAWQGVLRLGRVFEFLEMLFRKGEQSGLNGGSNGAWDDAR